MATINPRKGGKTGGQGNLWVVYPGDQKYALNDKIKVIPLDLISQLVGTGLDVQKNSAT
jgi:hypothetical protein